jgi:hypothetical protein
MVPTSLKIKIFKGPERGEHIAQARGGWASKHDIINTGSRFAKCSSGSNDAPCQNSLLEHGRQTE